MPWKFKKEIERIENVGNNMIDAIGTAAKFKIWQSKLVVSITKKKQTHYNEGR